MTGCDAAWRGTAQHGMSREAMCCVVARYSMVRCREGRHGVAWLMWGSTAQCGGIHHGVGQCDMKWHVVTGCGGGRGTGVSGNRLGVILGIVPFACTTFWI